MGKGGFMPTLAEWQLAVQEEVSQLEDEPRYAGWPTKGILFPVISQAHKRIRLEVLTEVGMSADYIELKNGLIRMLPVRGGAFDVCSVLRIGYSRYLTGYPITTWLKPEQADASIWTFSMAQFLPLRRFFESAGSETLREILKRIDHMYVPQKRQDSWVRFQQAS